jgi:hypothetical protein
MTQTPPPLQINQQTPTTIQQAFNFLMALSRRGLTLEVVNRENNRIRYRITNLNTRESWVAEMPENAQQTPIKNIILPNGHRS